MKAEAEKELLEQELKKKKAAEEVSKKLEAQKQQFAELAGEPQTNVRNFKV